MQIGLGHIKHTKEFRLSLFYKSISTFVAGTRVDERSSLTRMNFVAMKMNLPLFNLRDSPPAAELGPLSCFSSSLPRPCPAQGDDELDLFPISARPTS